MGTSPTTSKFSQDHGEPSVAKIFPRLLKVKIWLRRRCYREFRKLHGEKSLLTTESYLLEIQGLTPIQGAVGLALG